ncbi:MAG: hypothetical protein GY842_16755 [bacterium]|nr:hypothetical protein [bacterium]
MNPDQELLNNGPSDALNVEVSDPLPAGVSLEATSGCVEDPDGYPPVVSAPSPPATRPEYTIALVRAARTQKGGSHDHSCSDRQARPGWP